MKNKLTDLNDHLFAQLERLNDEDLPAEERAGEIDRARAVVGIGKTIVENARLVLDAEQLRLEYQSSGATPTLPGMLESKGGQ